MIKEVTIIVEYIQSVKVDAIIKAINIVGLDDTTFSFVHNANFTTHLGSDSPLLNDDRFKMLILYVENLVKEAALLPL